LLSNPAVACARAFTWEQQFELLDAAAGMMIEAPFKMLIIDSIMGCLRTDFSGRGELAERQQRLGQLMTRLRKVRRSTPRVAFCVFGFF
jgi:meiotic recombination protein DMC1